MVQVILSDEQAQVVVSAAGAVELRDTQGKLVGYITPRPSDAIIAEARRRAESDGPWFSTGEVLSRLDGM